MIDPMQGKRLEDTCLPAPGRRPAIEDRSDPRARPVQNLKVGIVRNAVGEHLGQDRDHRLIGAQERHDLQDPACGRGIEVERLLFVPEPIGQHFREPVEAGLPADAIEERALACERRTDAVEETERISRHDPLLRKRAGCAAWSVRAQSRQWIRALARRRGSVPIRPCS